MMRHSRGKYFTNSPQETIAVAQKFAKEVKSGDFIALFGELGGGKTTFIQGLVRGLGIKRRLISPTFIILRSYKIPGSLKNFYHADLYRIGKIEKEIDDLGLGEIIKTGKDIIAVEWAEKMKNFLPKTRWEIYFEHIYEKKRKITIRRINDQ